MEEEWESEKARQQWSVTAWERHSEPERVREKIIRRRFDEIGDKKVE